MKDSLRINECKRLDMSIDSTWEQINQELSERMRINECKHLNSPLDSSWRQINNKYNETLTYWSLYIETKYN